MVFDDVYHRAKRKARLMLGMDTRVENALHFEVPAAEARAADGALDTEIGRLFFANQGRVVHKWLQYFPVYERHLADYRGTDFKMLEIGVFKGGSIALWRDYFGSEATIFGIDIDPQCAGFVDPPNQVRIGSQADPAFLQSVVKEMGGLDVVLDDGSHVADHQQASFETLFPLLRDGGIYIIEDVHTAYWPREFNGGYRRRKSAIEQAKLLIDDMHHWYHGRCTFETVARGDVSGVHFYDSILVIEKRAARRPIDTQVGAGV
jgi:hypothetical protein